MQDKPHDRAAYFLLDKTGEISGFTSIFHRMQIDIGFAMCYN